MLPLPDDKVRRTAGGSFVLLLTALVLAPLAFGTVEPWSLAILEALCFLSLMLVLRKAPDSGKATLSGVPGLLPLSLFLGLVLIQVVPLPPDALRLVSPGTYHAHAVLFLDDSLPGWHPVSVDVRATLAELLRISAYAAAYIVAFRVMRDRTRLRTAAVAMMTLGIVLAMAATFQHLSMESRLLWIRPAPEGAQPFGPFVNRNHFAGLMVMMLPLILGLAFAWRPWAGRRTGVVASMAHADNQRRTAAFMFAVGGAVLVTLATFLSGSRSGALALAGSVVFFALLYVLQARKSRLGGLVLLGVVLVLMGLALGAVGWGPALERLDAAASLGSEHPFMRPAIWRDAVHAVRNYPALGAGVGSFGQMFTMYRSFPGSNTVLHAHNDYLELLTGGGIAGFALMGWFVLAVVWRAVRGLPRKAEPLQRYLFIGAATGVFAIMVQELVDFSLQTGAGGLYFFFLLGTLAALSQPTSTDTPPPRPLARAVVLPLASLLLITSLAFNAGAVLARLRGPDLVTVIGQTTDAGTLGEVQASALKASAFDPLNASYHGAACAAERLLGEPKAAMKQCMKALDLRPLDPDYRLLAAQVMVDLDQSADAGQLFRAAAATGGFDPGVHVRQAQWRFQNGQPERGLEAMRRAVELDPNNTSSYISIMALAGVSDEDMAQALPPLSRPFLAYAAYLERVGQNEPAVRALMDALSHLEAEKAAAAAHYLDISRRLKALERPGMALIAVEYALDRFPDNVELLHTAARLHESSGRIHQALGIYRHILTIAPGDRTAKHRSWLLEDILKK